MGVRIRSLPDFLSKSLRYQVLEIQLQNEDTVIGFARSKHGAGYDFLSVLFIAVRKLLGHTITRWKNTRRWFCSEFVIAAGVLGGLQPVPHSPRYYGVEETRQMLLRQEALDVTHLF